MRTPHNTERTLTDGTANQSLFISSVCVPDWSMTFRKSAEGSSSVGLRTVSTPQCNRRQLHSRSPFEKLPTPRTLHGSAWYVTGNRRLGQPGQTIKRKFGHGSLTSYVRLTTGSQR